MNENFDQIITEENLKEARLGKIEGAVSIDGAGRVGIGNTRPASTLDVSGGIRLNSGSATCSVSNRGELKFVQGASGVADKLYVCSKLASDTYAYISFSPNDVNCSAAENASCTASCPAGSIVTAVKYVRWGSATCGNAPTITGGGGACSGSPSGCTGAASCAFSFNNGNCGDTCPGYGKTGILVVTCQ